MPSMCLPTRSFARTENKSSTSRQLVDLPSLFESADYVEAGGLMSYGADRANSYRRVAYFVDRILKGAKPADLPVEQPKKFEFVINLKAAKQIGSRFRPMCWRERIRSLSDF